MAAMLLPFDLCRKARRSRLRKRPTSGRNLMVLTGAGAIRGQQWSVWSALGGTGEAGPMG